MTDYKQQQGEFERRARTGRVHRNEDRKPGARLQFSDRVMEVQPNGSLKTVVILTNGPLEPNPPGVPWFTISNSGERAEIRIWGTIGSPEPGVGVDAEAFVAELASIPRNMEIDLRIHSRGGFVWDALPIYNYLRARREYVTAHIDGLAASCASWIAMAAKEIRMPRTARMMIHDAQGWADGNSKRMKETAELLERETKNIADIYAEKTGKSRGEILAMMAKTTWMTGEEAKAQGFCDVVTDGAVLNCAEFDLSCFQRVPEALVHNSAKHPTTPNPMRDQILALLRKHGVTVSNTATDAELGTLLAQLENRLNEAKPTDLQAILNELRGLKGQLAAAGAAAPTPTPTPAPTNVLPLPTPATPTNVVHVTPEMWNAMQSQLAAERTHRITNEFNAIAAERTYLDRATWLPQALQNEAVLTQLRALPVSATGAEPIRNIITNEGNPLIEQYRKMAPGQARADFRVANFIDLEKAFSQMQQGPRNANTIAAALLPDTLSDALITISNNKLAMLNAFSRDFGTDVLKPRATVQVRKATAGGTVQTNPTNFETGDTTLAAIAVSVNLISKSFHITNDELNKGHKLQHVAQINADIFVNGIVDVIGALLIAANFPTPLVIGAAASFDRDDLKPIMAAGKNFKQKNLILDGGHLAYLLPTDTQDFRIGQQGAFGFDLVAENNRWTGGVANLVGLFCSPDALAVASGMPVELPNGEFLQKSTVTLPNGLIVSFCVWFSRAGRVHWASYDVMFGAAAADNAEAELLVTA